MEIILKFTIHCILTILLAVIIYLMFAFAANDLNTSNWDYTGRALYVLTFVGLSIPINVGIAYGLNDYNCKL